MVINLLTNLKLNGFTLNLLEIQKAIISDDDLTKTAFMGIYENFINFGSYYTAIAELAERKSLSNLRRLSDVERDEYIKIIENVLPQLPPHDGGVYKGNVRIK